MPVPAAGAFPAAAAAVVMDGDGVAAAAAAAELRGVLGCDALCGLGLLATGGRAADAAAACCCWRAADKESLLLVCSLLLLLPKGEKKGAPLGLAPRLLVLPARGEAQTPARTRASWRSSCRAAAFTSSMRLGAFSGCLGAPAGRFVAGAGSLARHAGLPLAASCVVVGPDGALRGALEAGLGGGRPRGTRASGVGAFASEEPRKRLGARATAPGWHDAAPGISRRAERSSSRPRHTSSPDQSAMRTLLGAHALSISSMAIRLPQAMVQSRPRRPGDKMVLQ